MGPKQAKSARRDWGPYAGLAMVLVLGGMLVAVPRMSPGFWRTTFQVVWCAFWLTFVVGKAIDVFRRRW